MAIVVQDTGQGLIRTTVGTTLSWSHTVSSGSDRILCVSILISTSVPNQVVTTVLTYGGVYLTKVAEMINTGSRMEFWQLINPTVGTATLSLSTSNNFLNISSHSFTLVNVAQQIPEFVSKATNATGTTSTQGITTTTNAALTIGTFGTNINATHTATEAGQSIIATSATSTSKQHSVSTHFGPTPGGLVTDGWSNSVNYTQAGQMLIVYHDVANAGDTLSGDIQKNMVGQRTPIITGTSGPVTWSALFTGQTPASVEARVKNSSGTTIVDWTPTTLTITGNSLKMKLNSIPVGNTYTVDIRSKTSGGSVIATKIGSNTFGIGKIIAVYGSSVSDSAFIDTPYDASSLLVSVYRQTGTSWTIASGTGIVALGNAEILSEPGVPIAFLRCGVAGIEAVNLAAKVTATGYPNLLTAIAAVGGLREADIISIGAQDARLSHVPSVASHLANLRLIRSNLVTDTTQTNVPLFVMAMQRAPDASAFDQGFTYARGAELQFGDDSNVTIGATTIDLTVAPDNANILIADSKIAWKRLQLRMAKVLRGAVIDSQGPKPISANYDTITGFLKITFDRRNGDSLVGKTSQTGITGFRVSNDNFATLLTITEAFVSSVNTVSLNIGPGISGTIVWDYLEGATPNITNCVGNNAIGPTP